MWFYENSNIIELHYGPKFLENDSIIYAGEGTSVGFFENADASTGKWEKLWYVVGNSEDPTLKKIAGEDGDTIEVTLDKYPAEGTVYRFIDGEVGIEEDENLKFFKVNFDENHQKIEITTIKGLQDKISYTLFDLQGKPMKQGSFYNNSKIDISNLKAASYILQLKNQHTIFNKVFVRP